jgi:hypothetical protein
MVTYSCCVAQQESIRMEIWKEISEYEGAYSISSYGRIRSEDRYVNCNSGKDFAKGKY